MSVRVALVIKTAVGGLWTLPQIDELRARGHEVTVVLPPGDGRLRRALDANEVPVVESRFSFRFPPRPATVSGLAGLRRQLVALAPDVIFYHLYASALAARLAGAGLGAARVHMVAGPLYLESPVIRTAERLLARLDTVTICGSEFTARAYRRLGRSRQATPAIPYGVDTTRFRPPGADVGRATRAELGIDGSAFVVVMVAFVYAPKRAVHRRRGIKGHDVLLDAWQEFHRTHPGSHLVLVGGGLDDAGERHRADLMDRYRLPAPGQATSWITTADDVRRYYAAADLSVSPSLSENHGAALEAGAMGVPSVVSDAGGLPETVGPETGWVVPRGDVTALTAALEAAYREHTAGTLAARGLRARELVRQEFERSRASSAVADVIEAVGGACGGSRTYSVFCETRFGRGRTDGTAEGWAGTDGASGWERYLRGGAGLRVVARADPRPGSGTVALPAGLRVVPVPFYVGLRQLAARVLPVTVAITRAVRDAETIILRLPGVVGSVAAAACRLQRRRYAVEVVGDPREVLAAGVAGRGGRLVASAAAAYTRWAVRGADTVRYVTRHRLQRRYPPGRGSAATATANVVLDPGSYVDRPRRWAPGRARIVAVGSHEQHYKGHDVLLRAVRQLLDGGADVDAVIVGGGRRHDEICALATSLGLDGRVTLTGAITDRRRLTALLDEASVFAMPSRTEGLPRALVEAMARALPAVGTDVGGIPELLDGRCTVPVDDAPALASALAELLRHPDLWEEQSRRNLGVARTYGADDLGRRFDTWLEDVPRAAARRGRDAGRGA